jgi:hypothetical protein
MEPIVAAVTAAAVVEPAVAACALILRPIQTIAALVAMPAAQLRYAKPASACSMWLGLKPL